MYMCIVTVYTCTCNCTHVNIIIIYIFLAIKALKTFKTTAAVVYSLKMAKNSGISLFVFPGYAVVRLDGSQPVRYGVKLEIDEKYRALRQSLADLTGIRKSNLLLVEMYGSMIRVSQFPKLQNWNQSFNKYSELLYVMICLFTCLCFVWFMVGYCCLSLSLIHSVVLCYTHACIHVLALPCLFV